VGPNMTHGVIFDLINKISVNSQILNVLGDGNQRKVYIHVEDLVDFMQDVIKVKDGITLNISNSDDGLAVKEIVTEILNIIGIETEVIYENKQEGWPGDVTICLMDNSKMRKFANLEFRSSKDSVKDAIISRLGEIKLCSV
jgi:UDP-glucose 4-epimerase